MILESLTCLVCAYMRKFWFYSLEVRTMGTDHVCCSRNHNHSPTDCNIRRQWNQVLDTHTHTWATLQTHGAKPIWFLYERTSPFGFFFGEVSWFEWNQGSPEKLQSSLELWIWADCRQLFQSFFSLFSVTWKWMNASGIMPPIPPWTYTPYWWGVDCLCRVRPFSGYILAWKV
jgi:hypothetical protein